MNDALIKPEGSLSDLILGIAEANKDETLVTVKIRHGKIVSVSCEPEKEDVTKFEWATAPLEDKP